jgi:hypothetical protein
MDFLWVSVSFLSMGLSRAYGSTADHLLTELCTHLGICVHVWPTVLSVENLDHHVCGLVGPYTSDVTDQRYLGIAPQTLRIEIERIVHFSYCGLL